MSSINLTVTPRNADNAIRMPTNTHPSKRSLLFAQECLPLNNLRLELHQEDSLSRPKLSFLAGCSHRMRRDPCRKASPVTSSLDNPRHERSAVQLAHFLGNADVLVDQRFIVYDHVLIWALVGFLESIGGPGEEVFPHDIDDEVEEGNDVEGPELCSWRFAPDEYVEEFEPDGMALDIESRVIMSICLSNYGRGLELLGGHTASPSPGYL